MARLFGQMFLLDRLRQLAHHPVVVFRLECPPWSRGANPLDEPLKTLVFSASPRQKTKPALDDGRRLLVAQGNPALQRAILVKGQELPGQTLRQERVPRLAGHCSSSVIAR